MKLTIGLEAILECALERCQSLEHETENDGACFECVDYFYSVERNLAFRKRKALEASHAELLEAAKASFEVGEHESPTWDRCVEVQEQLQEAIANAERLGGEG